MQVLFSKSWRSFSACKSPFWNDVAKRTWRIFWIILCLLYLLRYRKASREVIPVSISWSIIMIICPSKMLDIQNIFDRWMTVISNNQIALLWDNKKTSNRSRFFRGATRIWTGDRGVADLCLTTWLWHHYKLSPHSVRNDSKGIWTPVTAVKGRCLNRLTMEPGWIFSRASQSQKLPLLDSNQRHRG